MDALQRLQAFEATQRAARELRCEHGLPVEVREGVSLSGYAWQGGELARITEPDGTCYDYRYGPDGRLTEVDRNGRAWARYVYDGAGRLAEARRADGESAYDYDALGRLLRTRRGAAGPWVYRWGDKGVSEARSDHEHTAFEYDAAGRLVGLAQRVEGVALSLRFQFDAAGRLAGITFPEWQRRIGLAWDARGRGTGLSWNDEPVFTLGSDDEQRCAWSRGPDGLLQRTWNDPASGQPLREQLCEQWREPSGQDGRVLLDTRYERDEALRLSREGERHHRYDAQGRLAESTEGGQAWCYRHGQNDEVLVEGEQPRLACDSVGRVLRVADAGGERVFRYDAAGELESLLVNGECVGRFVYDHKGRLAAKHGPLGSERYLYGADDGLLAVADAEGRPKFILLRLPTGLLGLVDFRTEVAGTLRCLHADAGGNLVFCDGEGPYRYDPFGLPLQADGTVPAIYRGRFWHAELGLYRIGARWYDPRLRRFLTPDSHTGAPDDARLLNPFVLAGAQRMQRVGLLGDWLREPRLRCRFAYCANDPVNRFDPNGHWSFGGVLLSLLGVIWTLPNTAFGLAIEVSILIGEVVRWLVWAFTLGHVSWQTPGFDVASSGRLNAFALVFKGGWLGSFESLLGITFGNVFFVNGEYEQNAAWKALPDPVSPPAYNGTETIPKSQALYEHELRHVNQYGWFGPFFHLGLPLFGVYLWDVILHGYWNAKLEKDARDHGGFP